MARSMTANRGTTHVHDEPLSGSNSRGQARIERKWHYEIAYAALVVGAAALVLSPVLRHSGWPLNQGTAAPLLLVQIYAAHIRHLDLIPVWSSSDALGLGSPVLLFYHRAFFYLAGAISLFGIGLKASVVLAIAIFLAIGAYGMRLSLSMVTDSRLLIHDWLAGISLHKLCVHRLVGSSGGSGRVLHDHGCSLAALFLSQSGEEPTGQLRSDPRHGGDGERTQCDRAVLLGDPRNCLRHVRDSRQVRRDFEP